MMGVGHWIKRVEADKSGKVQDAGHVILETSLLLEHAEEMIRDHDEPEDASLAWLEAVDDDADIEADCCHDPTAVLKSLTWLQRLATEKNKDHALFARDLESLLRLCEDARKADQLIVHVVVL